jgi:hypothetical protein
MHVRTRRGRAALSVAVAAVALLGTSAPAWATNGTIRVLKGGDRVAGHVLRAGTQPVGAELRRSPSCGPSSPRSRPASARLRSRSRSPGRSFAYPGDTLTFNFTVRNTGDLTLTGVTVSDDRCTPVTGGQGTLAPCRKQVARPRFTG